MSVMLAAPSLAAASTTNPSPDSAQAAMSPATPMGKGAAARPASQSSRRSTTRTYALRHTVRHAYASPMVRRVHYAPTRQTAFIDDAVAWSEPGRNALETIARAGTAAQAETAGGRVQTGMASWYGGSRWNGRRTANGEVYQDGELTGAHSSLPIGSLVRVTVLDTGRSVIVRINDRIGTRHRVIDLSRAAAHALDIENRGIAQVALAPM